MSLLLSEPPPLARLPRTGGMQFVAAALEDVARGEATARTPLPASARRRRATRWCWRGRCSRGGVCVWGLRGSPIGDALSAVDAVGGAQARSVGRGTWTV